MQKITEVTGKGIAVRGNDMDTDRIIPARFMKEVTFTNMGKYAFYDERFDEKGSKKTHPFNDEKFGKASILIVNKNFGCGSSREHAPQSLMRWGIKAIIGESFADIFEGNCSMMGLPTATSKKETIDELMAFVENYPDEDIKVDIQNRKIKLDSTGFEIHMNHSIKKLLVEGTWDTTSMMLEAKGEIKKTMSGLPYTHNF